MQILIFLYDIIMSYLAANILREDGVRINKNQTEYFFWRALIVF